MFLANFSTILSEGRRPCLGRPSRRSLARVEGPVQDDPTPTILRLY